MIRFNTLTFVRLWYLTAPFFSFRVNFSGLLAILATAFYLLLVGYGETFVYRYFWRFWNFLDLREIAILVWLPWLLVTLAIILVAALSLLLPYFLYQRYKKYLLVDIHWQAWILLLLLIAFAIAVSAISAKINYLGGDFFTALEVKEERDYLRKLLYFVMGFALITPINALYRFVEERFGLYWRRWLSHEILRDYFSARAYYKIAYIEGIDNPDQRISEDIRNFTATFISLFVIFTNAILNFCLFIYILWSISTNLIYAVLFYAFLGSLITYLVGRPLIQLNFLQLKKEANYRYKLVNVRDNAESIAFFRGDRKELTRSRQKLKKAISNQQRIIKLNLKLNMLLHGYNNLKIVIPVMMVAGLYMDGTIKFGQVYQAQGAFLVVLDSLSIFIQHFGSISSLTAIITRLGSFREGLFFERPTEANGGETIKSSLGGTITFDQVTILTPKRDQELVRDLSFTLDSGGMLINGASGSGKSSILRAVSGLWNTGSGKIQRPELSSAIFLPQRPYMVIGTLRNQLLYASSIRGISDKELRTVMEEVGLESVLKRVSGLGTTKDWYSILSTGEQQKLAFARLLIAKPKYAFLDEATTAIDEESEQLLYGILQKRLRAYMSIGYRPNLYKFHEKILRLKGDGAWEIETKKHGK
ncbi:MAG: ABC transporter ATP-binding protein/permease [Deltaproteobacteria bacterium]|nr:ABC transporter ATP-binding protein/permease [Deltaproteobacteria bacterium]